MGVFIRAAKEKDREIRCVGGNKVREPPLIYNPEIVAFVFDKMAEG